MAAEKKQRNVDIYTDVKNKLPYKDILKKHGLKSKKSIYIIVRRIEDRANVGVHI